jgi:hypothetical protein
MLIWILHLNTTHRVFLQIQSVIYHWKALDKSFPKTYKKPYFGGKIQKLGFPRGSERLQASTCKNPFGSLSDLRDILRGSYMCSLIVSRSPFRVSRSSFGVSRSSFGVSRSSFGVSRSSFGVSRSSFRAPLELLWSLSEPFWSLSDPRNHHSTHVGSLLVRSQNPWKT